MEAAGAGSSSEAKCGGSSPNRSSDSPLTFLLLLLSFVHHDNTHKDMLACMLQLLLGFLEYHGKLKLERDCVVG